MILSIDSGYDRQNIELLLLLLNYWYTSLNIIYTVHVDQEIFIVLLSVRAAKTTNYIFIVCAKCIIMERILSHDSKKQYLHVAQNFCNPWC